MSSEPVPQVDVVIVGAGLSGVGAACHLTRECPGRTFLLLEARDAIGGTWDLFRYPGVRSDSDMFTLGYAFRPWTGDQSIAEGPAIRGYIEDTAAVYGIRDKIRFGHRVVAADWSSAEGRWTVTAQRADTGEAVQFSCAWLSVCSGYYRYDEGFRPRFEGEQDFRGPIVHPQHWPADLDYAGKAVVVIGSGATAVTLVPTLAEQAGHVTMLQRTPSYVVSLPRTDRLARVLRQRLSAARAYPLVRAKNILVTTLMYQFSRRRPQAMKALVRKGLVKALPAGFDVDTHFTPPYDPWDQRLCLDPDGDLFQALSSGTVELVTDRIARFTADGVELESGTTVPADIVVTATGLTLLPVGGMRLCRDGEPVDLSSTVSYKGMMICGVPNFAMVVGYTNASWTLKADLVNRYVCRLLNHMVEHGYTAATPVPPAGGGTAPFLDLSSGYVQRSVAQLPRQGPRAPWRLHQNYLWDVWTMRRGPLADEGMSFSRAAVRSATEPAA